METISINQIDLEQFSDNYVVKLISLSFQYYDLNIDKDKYEEDVDGFIEEFVEYKPSQAKTNLKFIMDFIDDYSCSSDESLKENLEKLGLRNETIEYFIKMMLSYREKINLFKISSLGKASKYKILNFNHNFYVKYADSYSDKVDFHIKVCINYLNDENENKNLNMDMTINQFYNLFNEFEKIETIIKTLI